MTLGHKKCHQKEERLNARRTAVEAAIAAGTAPAYPRGSQNFRLKLAGNKRAVLVREAVRIHRSDVNAAE